MKPGEALHITSWEGLRARHGQGPSSMLLGCIPWVLFPDCLRRHKALNPPSLRGSDVEEESGAGLSRLRCFLAVMQCCLRTPSSSPIEFGSSEMKRPIPSAWAAVSLTAMTPAPSAQAKTRKKIVETEKKTQASKSSDTVHADVRSSSGFAQYQYCMVLWRL